MKNIVKDMHETLIKFTKGKEDLDLILLNQMPSLKLDWGLNLIDHIVKVLIRRN